jgi:hypothetical protein
MIVIGSKPYNNLNISKVIDTFKNNIRFNFAIPGQNNGTKIDSQFICREVLNFLNNGIHVKSRKADIMEKFKKIKYSYKNIFMRYDIPQVANIINKYLHDVNIPIILKNPRTGIIGIILAVSKCRKPNIYMYSIYNDETYSSFYDKFDPKTKFDENTNHDNNLIERNLILSLHQKKIIDASFCMLKDYRIPTFDIRYANIQPSFSSIKKIIDSVFPVCILEFNHENTNTIKEIQKQIEYIFENSIATQSEIITSNNISIKNKIFNYCIVVLCSDINHEKIKILTGTKNESMPMQYKKNNVLIFNTKNITEEIFIENAPNITFYINATNIINYSSYNSQNLLKNHNFYIHEVKPFQNKFIVKYKKININSQKKTKRRTLRKMEIYKQKLILQKKQRQRKMQKELLSLNEQKKISSEKQKIPPNRIYYNEIITQDLKQQEMNTEKIRRSIKKKHEEITKQINYFQTQKIKNKDAYHKIQILKQQQASQQRQQIEVNEKLNNIKKQIDVINKNSVKNIR